MLVSGRFLFVSYESYLDLPTAFFLPFIYSTSQVRQNKCIVGRFILYYIFTHHGFWARPAPMLLMSKPTHVETRSVESTECCCTAPESSGMHSHKARSWPNGPGGCPDVPRRTGRRRGCKQSRWITSFVQPLARKATWPLWLASGVHGKSR